MPAVVGEFTVSAICCAVTVSTVAGSGACCAVFWPVMRTGSRAWTLLVD
jgi:hypothetical protein